MAAESLIEARYLTVEEAALWSRQSRSTIRRKVASGDLEAYRLGEHGPLRIPVTALEEHLQPRRPGLASLGESPQARRGPNGAVDPPAHGGTTTRGA